MKHKTLSLNTELNPFIAANSSAPLWVELIPAGTDVVGRDSRSWKNPSPENIVQAFSANGADLPIDIEHATEHKAPKGERAEAVGWIKTIQARNGGAIWGLVEWNAQGKQLIESKAYRYLSPVFTYDTNSKQILQLYSAGLTNQPNLHLTALNQRKPTNGDAVMPIPLAICTALGLSSEATEPQAVNAITQLKDDKNKALNNANNPSIDKFVPRADHDAAINRAQAAEDKLNEHQQKALNHRVDDEIDKALKAGLITPATTDYHRACCKQEGGLDRFLEFVKHAPKIADDSNLDDKSAHTQTTLSPDDKAACAMLGIDEADFKKAKEIG